MTDLIYSINKTVYSTGSLGIGTVKDESKLRFVIEGAAGGNSVEVRGRILGQSDWDLLATLTGSAKQTVTVMTYDEVEVFVTAFAPTADEVKVIATSFNEASGSTSIDAPTGGTVSGDEITFTSSDNSITITADPLTSTIDFISSAAGMSKYTQSFVTGDWILNGSNYELTVLSVTFGNKMDPVVHTYETIAGEDSVINPSIIRTATNDIILQVTQVPDNRYIGKIIIL